MREILGFAVEEKVPPPPVLCRGRPLDFSRVRVMGVLNATPDSFSDGGRFFEPGAALDAVAEMAEQGADIIDIGGESTRPGAEPVSANEELRRVMPILERLEPAHGPLLSIDTRRPVVARAALGAGVHVVNDVTALADPEMRALVAEAGAGVVLMHMRGEPRTMQENPVYADVVREVAEFLRERAEEAERDGVRSVLVDPGIGFGKTWDHNLEILQRIPALAAMGRPVVVGVSRKAFIGGVTEVEEAARRLVGTKVAEAFAVWRGADMIRTHDVGAALEAIRMAGALVRGRAREGR